MGELDIFPQDLTRVFLKIAGNACDMTDEKRRIAVEAGRGERGYLPTLWLCTRRREHQIEIRFRDDGNGIPSSQRTGAQGSASRFRATSYAYTTGHPGRIRAQRAHRDGNRTPCDMTIPDDGGSG